MKRLKKILLWLICIAVLLAVLFAVALALFFPKEKVKYLVLEKMSAALGRPVTVESVSTTFWGGIGLNLENIRVANLENFGKKDFLTSSGIDVKVQFWPLIKKEIYIDRIIVNDPVINAQKLADGRVNYDFSASDTLAPEEIREALPEDSRLASVAALSLDNMTIQNGRLNYTDDSSGLVITTDGLELSSSITTSASMIFKPQGSLEADRINIRFGDMIIPQLTAKLKFSGDVDLNKSNAVFSISNILVNNLPFSAKIGIPNLKSLAYINTEIETGLMMIADIMTIVPADYMGQLQGYRVDGQAQVVITVKYNALAEYSLQYSGDAALEDIIIAGDSLPFNINISKAASKFDNQKLEANIEKGELLGNPFTGKATVLLDKSPIASMNINGQIDLSSLQKLLPEPETKQIAGDMKYDLEVSNITSKLGKINIVGSASINGGKYIADDLPERVNSFEMDISFLPDRLKVNNLDIEFESSDISYTGEIFDIIPFLLSDSTETPLSPHMTFELTSAMLNIDSLVPEAVPGAMADSIEITAGDLPPVFIPLFDGNGSCRLDTLKYSGVEFTNLTANITIANKKITISDVRGDAYSGQVSGNSSIDFGNMDNPVYSGEFDAENIEADDFMSRFTGLGGHLYGKVNMSGSFETSGWDAEPIINSLNMDGNADFKEARLVNFELVKKLATTLKFDEFDEEKLRDLTTAFHVEDGRVALDEMSFLSKIGDWALSGSVGFDGSLDYRGTVLLSEQVTSNLLSQQGLLGSLSGLFKQKSTGRIKVPFTLGGTYSKPDFALDLSSSDALQENIKDNLGDALNNLFKKK